MKITWCLTDYVLPRNRECYEQYWISHLSHKENGSTRGNIRILHIVTPTYIYTWCFLCPQGEFKKLFRAKYGFLCEENIIHATRQCTKYLAFFQIHSFYYIINIFSY